MIVSHAWLKQFVPHSLTADAVGELLSRHCVTLDGIERVGADLSSFVVAQVVEARRHPNSDHLWVTRVDDGSGTLLDVVCGAPNVVAGARYPFARSGTVMPSGLKIERRKIRGETSNGMLCSSRELGIGEEHDGIYTLETDVAPGTPLTAVLDASDARLALDVLPNRPDLLSHRGVAREICAIAGSVFSPTPVQDLGDFAITAPTVRGEQAVSFGGVHVRVDDAASCPQYIAVVIRGVTVGPSPRWLVDRLASIGLRSISNVVDATNYVLHGLGQPVHAFDVSKLAGSTIVVRRTHDDESLVTLDGVDRALVAGTTVICDAERPVALAGVMGGRATEVTNETRDLLLEVAVFDERFVRRVRRAVGLNTDASYRYERGVDAGGLRESAMIGTALICLVAGGSVESMLVVGNAPAKPPMIALREQRIAQLLGVFVPGEQVVARLQALGCAVVRGEHALHVTPPSWRHDLKLEVDLIEEVARLGGYDTLPNDVRPFRAGAAPDHPLHLASRRVRDALVGMGYAECRPMPFTATGDEHTPRVRNPLAEDEPFLRASLLDTLSRRAEYNLSRMQGNLRLFEVGNAFAAAPGRLPREETRVAVLLMGSRRPPHFTEPQPPAFDEWDAKSVAERVLRAVFPGDVTTLARGEGRTLWWLSSASAGVVGRVERLTLERPLWATEAFGIELTIGVMSSADVAEPQQHAHDEAAECRRNQSAGVRYRALPATPSAEFDVALLVPDGTAAATVEDAIRQAGGELLESATLFDEYRGNGVADGYRSLAWRLTFRHPDRTLRDKEIEGRRARLLDILAQELGIRPRAS